MSRGPGITQRAIMDALRADELDALTIADLAGRLGRSPRQVRTAVRALEQRGLVVVTSGSLGWRGAGEYGRLARRGRWGQQEGLPVAHVVREGEHLPYSRWYVATRDLEYVRAGMPTFGLWVWLAERHQRYQAESAERLAHVLAMYHGIKS